MLLNFLSLRLSYDDQAYTSVRLAEIHTNIYKWKGCSLHDSVEHILNSCYSHTHIHNQTTLIQNHQRYYTNLTDLNSPQTDYTKPK